MNQKRSESKIDRTMPMVHPNTAAIDVGATIAHGSREGRSHAWTSKCSASWANVALDGGRRYLYLEGWCAVQAGSCASRLLRGHSVPAVRQTLYLLSCANFTYCPVRISETGLLSAFFYEKLAD